MLQGAITGSDAPLYKLTLRTAQKLHAGTALAYQGDYITLTHPSHTDMSLFVLAEGGTASLCYVRNGGLSKFICSLHFLFIYRRLRWPSVKGYGYG